MGIKYLTTYLRDHPHLCHEVLLEWRHDDTRSKTAQRNHTTTRNLIVWDAPGWMNRCFGHFRRETKLLFDFKVLERECRNIVSTFKRFGFEVVAFLDGYFCGDKIEEKRGRKLQWLQTIRESIGILRSAHNADSLEVTRSAERERLLYKMEWMPSSGFFHFMAQALSAAGCTVYRGTGTHDVDRDIVQFIMEHKDTVYGLMTRDSDFYAFSDLDIPIINDFHFKTKMYGKRMVSQSIEFTYSLPSEIWKTLGLHSEQQRMELIAVVGNDFVPKSDWTEVLRRCGVGEKEIENEKNVDHHTATDPVPDSEENESNHIESDHEKKKDAVNSITSKLNELIVRFQTVSDQPLSNQSQSKWKWKYDVIETASNAILRNTLKEPVNASDVEKLHKFYTIDTTQTLKMEKNVNPIFCDLMTNHVFSGGFHFHDIDAVGFCIHQKLGPLRHALFRKELKLDVVKEYIPEIECSQNTEEKSGDDTAHTVTEKVDVWKYRLIDLRLRRHDDSDLSVELLTEDQHQFGSALYFVFKNTLKILTERQWITKEQSVALELQFEIRFGLNRVYRKWPFYREYRAFLKNGIPMIQDLTAQSLYWECARLLCLNQKLLMPPIWKLFDGPLFHFFCDLQRGGDSRGFISGMMARLKAMDDNGSSFVEKANGNGGYESMRFRSMDRGRGRGDWRRGGFVMRGRGRGYNGKYPVCRFYNGTDGSCARGVECRFQHVKGGGNRNGGGFRERGIGGKVMSNRGARGRGRGSTPSICRFFDGSQGSCVYGAQCHFQHIISGQFGGGGSVKNANY